MGKRLFILFVGLLVIPAVEATHNRAGEITLTQISDFTYEILIQTFTYSRSAADRDTLAVQWGDGTYTRAQRIFKHPLSGNYFWNKYTARHTFPGPGTYTIVVQDPNRNFGVKNIPNSVNVIFSIKTTIAINPGIGFNNTPVLLNPPIDKAAVGQVFVHNPAAFDPDGDSISYKLGVCTEENGQPIEDYTLPDASDSLYINEATGDLIWNTPVDTGIYNIAIEIEEWRRGVKIGSIARDMQIDVYATDNRPPSNMPLRDFCIEAGDSLVYDIISTDPDSNRVSQGATGGPFLDQVSPPEFTSLVSGRGYSASRFKWRTDCRHIRNQPYNIIVKAVDDHPELNLVDISNFHIKVLGPAPRNPMTLATATTIDLSWEAPDCNDIRGYEIYRRTGSSGYTPDSCSNGIPGQLGYSLIGYVPGRDSTFFMDNNDGESLLQGTEYCYMILAIYEDGTPGYPSAEVCDVLIPGTPAILQASVEKPAVDGKILISWAKPRDLDTVPPPYEYILFRSDSNAYGQDLQQIHSFITADLNDTTYIDSSRNTLVYPYSYKLDLYGDINGNRFRIGRQETVSTTWLEITGEDNANVINIRKNTPWVNDEFIVYRYDTLSGIFDSIGFTTQPVFVDSGLRNNQWVCYRVRTKGSRTISNADYDAINFTHIGCGKPVDLEASCPPDLNVESFCDSNFNFLIWTNPNNYCADDIVKYRIFYTPRYDEPYMLIDSTLSATDTSYIHVLTGSHGACYSITAIDSAGNESDTSVIACTPICFDYELPNVFTPNGDGTNDYFVPSSYSYVEKVDMKIYNRWGTLVYQTNDPDINWDGKRMNTDKIVPPGIYYYVCDVYESQYPELEVVRNIVGFVYVFTDKDAVNPGE